MEISEEQLQTIIAGAISQASGQHLDNSITGNSMLCEEASEMRVRVNTGSASSTVWVSGKSQDEINDRIVEAYVKSGRIQDFLKVSVPETSTKNTFRSYTEHWLKTFKLKKIKPTTMSGYRTMLRQHIYPAFGDRPFASITSTDIQQFLNDRSNLSQKYLTDMVKFIGSIAKDAVEDRVIAADPTASRRLFIPSKKKTVRQALTAEHFQEIANQLHVLSEIDRKYMALVMFTGLRRGEVLGLQWEDIDFDQKLIHVRRNVTFVNSEAIIGTTKTESGLRDVPLCDHLIAYLEPRGISGYIIHGRAADQPLCYASLNRMSRRIADKIDLHGATAHVFRHTYLTLLAGTGVDVKTLQAIAGHSDIQITMNRYVHQQTDKIRDAGALFDRVICAGICAAPQSPETVAT